ncbi:hypothetical protein DdX_11002 [Ditylenchus destructor]|uniref:Uncharacterized protein n=1 Tax=Ditylenchus destructor TaxID=166010 RepID=A0AAD4R4T9_9BILA|nr:hypothetical protein DdX_11002 [Ditylenchus destructor]
MLLLLTFLLLPCFSVSPSKVTRYDVAQTSKGPIVVEVRQPSGHSSPPPRRPNRVVEEPPRREHRDKDRERERRHKERPRDPDRHRKGRERKSHRRREEDENPEFLIVFHGMESTVDLVLPGITSRSTVDQLRDALIRSTRTYLVEDDGFQAEVRKGERPYFYPEYVKYNELKRTRLKDIKFFQKPPHFHANIYPLVVHKAGREDKVAIFRFPEYRTVRALKKSLVDSGNIEKYDTLHALVTKRGGRSHIMELQDASRLHRIPFKDKVHHYYVNCRLLKFLVQSLFDTTLTSN